ncbi:MAG: response regulator [Alphaproteobacteria bacterium]
MFGKNNIKVLIADDHDLIRDGLAPFINMLSKGQTIIEEACDFFQLIAFPNSQFDLVLADLRMPGMNGLFSIKQIIEKFAPAPVVIMSGFVNDIDINEAVKLGVRGFIPKNMKGEAMVFALQLILSGETYIPSQIILDNSSHKTSNISERETGVVNLLSQGFSNKEIAKSLGIREVTVKVHLRNIYRKLGVSNRVQAIKKFNEDNL